MFVKGNTAMDGLCGNVSAGPPCDDLAAVPTSEAVQTRLVPAGRYSLLPGSPYPGSKEYRRAYFGLPARLGAGKRQPNRENGRVK